MALDLKINYAVVILNNLRFPVVVGNFQSCGSRKKLGSSRHHLSVLIETAFYQRKTKA